MSDSVVNTGSQDVLSSVKRLVDKGSYEESEYIFIPTAPVPRLGRLVLTDALRVGDEPLVLTDALRVSDEPLILEKPVPLKGMPQKSTREGSPDEAANAPNSPAAEPLRLQPSDVVREGDVGTNAKVSEDASKHDLAGSLSVKMEVLEAAFVETEGQRESDGERDDSYSGTKTKGVEWTDENGIAQTQSEEAIFQSKPDSNFIRDPEVVRRQAGKPITLNLSEEDLRDLVAQIAREELKGALGERITRSLRKMVRREIARAAMAQGPE